MLLLLSLGLPSAHATDVLFVDATPVSMDDFSVAGLFYGMVVAAAEEEGLSFQDADVIRGWAGADADGCWDTDTCPGNLWERTDARLVVVMSVGSAAGGLQVGVRLHNADDTAPFKVLDQLVRSGEEVEFAASIARTAENALPLLPERKPSSGVMVLEEERISGPLPELDPEGLDPVEEPEKKPESKPEKKPESKPEKKPETKPEGKPSKGESRTRAELRADEERRKMGVHRRAFAAYEASGLSQAEWLAKARVRSGHGWLELGGGWGLGDVDRGYGVRMRLEAKDGELVPVGTSSWEGGGMGSSPSFAAALGYSPTWFLDTSVSVGVQYGSKHLDTGWECPVGCQDELAAEDTFDPVGAVQAIVEPRFRVYPVATGVVKPYLLVAFTVMIHDGFSVPDTEFIDYPSTQGGAVFGPTAGLGVAVDANSRFSLYAEVPATLLIDEPTVVQDGEVSLDPGVLESGGFLVRFVGGIAVRL